jgi:hypothetical protein
MTAKRNMSPPITPCSENLPLFEAWCLQGKALRRVAISAPCYLLSHICNQLKIHNIKSLKLAGNCAQVTALVTFGNYKGGCQSKVYRKAKNTRPYMLNFDVT